MNTVMNQIRQYTENYLRVESYIHSHPKNLIDASKLLLQSDEFGNTVIHLAAATNEIKMILILRDMIATKELFHRSLITINREGMQPLHLCSQFNCLRVAQFLLKNEVPRSHFNFSGLTPLHLAVKFGNPGLVKMYLDFDVDPNIQTKQEGLTPLMMSIQLEHQEITTSLLNFRSTDVNIVSSKGATALHYALWKQSLFSLQKLLTCGANICIENGCIKSPYQLALESGDNEIKMLFTKTFAIISARECSLKSASSGSRTGRSASFSHSCRSRVEPDTTYRANETILNQIEEEETEDANVKKVDIFDSIKQSSNDDCRRPREFSLNRSSSTFGSKFKHFFKKLGKKMKDPNNYEDIEDIYARVFQKKYNSFENQTNDRDYPPQSIYSTNIGKQGCFCAFKKTNIRTLPRRSYVDLKEDLNPPICNEATFGEKLNGFNLLNNRWKSVESLSTCHSGLPNSRQTGTIPGNLGGENVQISTRYSPDGASDQRSGFSNPILKQSDFINNCNKYNDITRQQMLKPEENYAHVVPSGNESEESDISSDNNVVHRTWKL